MGDQPTDAALKLNPVEAMNAREFFFLTAAMRDAQKRYFKTRDDQVFRACRKLENEIDAEIARVKSILDRQP